MSAVKRIARGAGCEVSPSGDKRIPGTGHQPPAIGWAPVLVVAGLLLLIAGGVLVYVNWAAYAEPPPPLGLEENPLPVVMGGDLPAREC